MTSPAGPRRWAARSGAGGILASSWDRRARTWPGARTRIAQCRVSRGGRARAARTWPTQLCGAHLLRDIEDAAQSYPGAIWPGQIADALRALIHAANLAREQPLTGSRGPGLNPPTCHSSAQPDITHRHARRRTFLAHRSRRSRTTSARMVRVSLRRAPRAIRSMTQPVKAPLIPDPVTSFRTPWLVRQARSNIRPPGRSTRCASAA
jgi:hypothetical protein